MTSFLAVVFFCANECFFWSGKKLHPNEASCIKELAVVVKEIEKQGVEAAFQCIRVPLTET